MPLVLARGSSAIPHNDLLMRMKDSSARHRSRRLAYQSKAANDIEYKQTAAYERSIKRPLLPTPPKPGEVGWSTPEWDAIRAAWLCYKIDDESQWTAWDAFREIWVNIGEFDRNIDADDIACGTAPPTLQKNESSMNSSSVGESPDTQGSSTSSDNRRFSFKTVAQTVMRILALQKKNTIPEATESQ